MMTSRVASTPVPWRRAHATARRACAAAAGAEIVRGHDGRRRGARGDIHRDQQSKLHESMAHWRLSIARKARLPAGRRVYAA
jgi:hypothetical protein